MRLQNYNGVYACTPFGWLRMHALPPPNPLNKTPSSNLVSHSPEREYELNGTKKEKEFFGAIWIVAFGHKNPFDPSAFFPRGGGYR